MRPRESARAACGAPVDGVAVEWARTERVLPVEPFALPGRGASPCAYKTPTARNAASWPAFGRTGP